MGLYAMMITEMRKNTKNSSQLVYFIIFLSIYSKLIGINLNLAKDTRNSLLKGGVEYAVHFIIVIANYQYKLLCL
jgi:hypothetical protein